MVVEKANIGDIPDLVQLRLAYLREDNGHLDDDETEVIQKDLPGYFQKHLDRDLFAYVIRENRNIVSCAFLLGVEKPMSPAFLNGLTGIVLNVYTRPSFRRRGYAESIMKTLLAEAKEKELSVVELKATEAGYPLYKKIGFSDDASKYHSMKWTNQSFKS
jgi:predicted acetyltransferase